MSDIARIVVYVALLGIAAWTALVQLFELFQAYPVALAFGAGVVGVLVALLARMVTNRRRSAWLRIAENRRLLDEQQRRIEYADQNVGYRSNSSERAGLVMEVARIEAEANRILQSERQQDGALTLFAIRSLLRSGGYWSEDDIIAFDEALVTRNKLVHGDGGSVPSSLVARSLQQASALLRRLEAVAVGPDGKGDAST